MDQLIYKIDISSDNVDVICNFDSVSEIRNNCPTGLALNEKERVLYFADARIDVIRKLDLIKGRVTTICGNANETRGSKDGIGKEALFNHPLGIALDSISNYLYVADNANHSIRRITLNERKVETLWRGIYGCEDGLFENARFHRSYDIVLNSATQELYVSDTYTHVIRVLSLNDR